MPGTYTVRLTYRDHTDETTVDVRMDPRLSVPREALIAQEALMERWMEHMEVATEAMDRLRASQKTIEAVGEQLADREDDPAQAVKDQGKAARDSIKTLIERFSGKEAKGIRRDPTTVASQLFTAGSYVQTVKGAHGAVPELALRQAEAALAGWLDDVNGFYRDDWPAYRQAVDAAAVSFFETYEPLRLGTD